MAMNREEFYARTMHTPDDPDRAARRATLREISRLRRIRVEVTPQRLDAGVLVPANSTLVEFLRGQSGNVPETIPFGTELPYMVALGAEACVFGPGDIRVAHRTGEYVAVADLQRGVEILAAAIERFAQP